MRFYEIFGGILESELEFPELRPTRPGVADWIIRTTDSPVPAGSAESIGWDAVEPDVRVQAYRLAGGYRLKFDDTGVFDVSSDGREISWRPSPSADERAARLDLTGRVLALALHLGGCLCLHASAVSIGGRAIAFLAPKGSGKSTLAVALERAGAELMSDDIVPVELRPAPMARPGAHSVRMFRDTAAMLGMHIDFALDSSTSKPMFRDSAIGRRRVHAAPLDALYLLSSVSAPDAPPVHRKRLSEPAAVTRVLGQTKIGVLLGGPEAAAVLHRTADLVSSVPVYELEVARDFSRLDDVVGTFFAWHSHEPERAVTPVADCA
ncbi:MAG TPA: hypothetical protein VFZ56_00405 [Gemmatimonadaceae bacterium]